MHRLVAASATTVYLGVAVRHRGEPRPAERRVFTRVNDLPDTPVHRVLQQVGTPWALPVGAVVLAASGRRVEAVAAAAALPVVKGVEVATKKVVQRPRPLYVVPTALRDDAPVEGPSYPSGHAAIAAATTYLLAPLLPRPAWWAAVAATGLGSSVRVNQGAHWPSDTLGGAALGVAVASGLCAGVRHLPRGRSLLWGATSPS